ncbi:DNA alkylation repair protein [Natronoflexus pectinivorans]|uniref:DNA alkylation repair enzyme n=1 Tax=Natronoflexus pectinivorans TaxID=682526 RepID=A0A4R2GPD6_9BACT|nr:DNA alkylation repair protein [Natronoflexus pectinivorans]TCO10898.1 DNA alkylation repair enzyme [Natronoflexus pectinivorans]
MNSNQLVDEVRAYCHKHSNPQNLQKYQRYFKGGYDGYGLTTIQITAKVKEIAPKLDAGIETALKAVPVFMESGMYEETSFGLLIVDSFEKELTPEVFDLIGSWFAKGITNWAHADTLGMYLLPKFLKKNIIAIEDFKPWLQSEYKFQRRCVPVTLIKSLKIVGIEKPMQFVEPLMTDTEREVHQGVGWFLREGWKLNPNEVELFLLKWKETAPRLIFQYACEKMEKEERLRFRRTKKGK